MNEYTDLDWNQSEDEVASNGKDFVNSNDIPDGEYVIKFGKLKESPKPSQRTGVPYYWLECMIVSEGPYKGQFLDQQICGPPDPNAYNYEDWAKWHNASRGNVNRWVKAMGIPPISRMSELEGEVLQVEWREKNGYKGFGHIQKPPPKSDFKPAPPKAQEPAPERTAADRW